MEFFPLEMKLNVKNVILLMLIISNQNLCAQTDIRMGPCATITGFGFIINGLAFYSNDSNYYKSLSPIKFCEHSRNIYYLEGLQLTEKTFLKIGFKQKDIIKNSLVFTIQGKNNNLNCFDTINLYVKLSIPIKLNGAILKMEEKEGLSKNLEIEKINSISRKKIFKGGILEITTME